VRETGRGHPDASHKLDYLANLLARLQWEQHRNNVLGKGDLIFPVRPPPPWVVDGRVIPNFMAQAIRGENLTVFGDGSQTRSFCYVDDMIEGIYRLLFSDYQLPVNIGNPDEITILEFADEILRVTGGKIGLTYLPLPENDPLKRQPDIALARKLLDWEPKVSREQGMKITYEYFKILLAQGIGMPIA